MWGGPAKIFRWTDDSLAQRAENTVWNNLIKPRINYQYRGLFDTAAFENKYNYDLKKNNWRKFKKFILRKRSNPNWISFQQRTSFHWRISNQRCFDYSGWGWSAWAFTERIVINTEYQLLKYTHKAG